MTQASSRSTALVLAILLACAAAALALSSQSFWVDEAQTGLKAMQPTLAGWWQALTLEHNTNLQLPLYMIYIWAWARIFGVSEMALRAANLPFFFLGFGAIWHFLRGRTALRSVIALIFCIHPFVWSYLNEARPYLMQLSGAMLLAGAYFEAMSHPDEQLRAAWWWLFGIGLIVSCGSGILGIPWAIAITSALSFRRGFFASLGRHGIAPGLICGALLATLAGYFLWTIRANVEASILEANPLSYLSLFYDQLGFAGLGPGRIEMRQGALMAIRPYAFALALLGFPVAWGLILAARQRFGMTWRQFLQVAAIVVVTTALIFLAGYLKHTRILARHLMPLFPFVIAAQAMEVLLLWRSRGILNRVAAALILTTLLFSSLQIRFASRHAKDDDRAAAAAAASVLAQGGRVWWLGSYSGALYYHLPVSITETPGAAWFMVGAPARYSALPDAIFISRPDISDPTGALAALISANHYRQAATWQSFTMWRRPM